MKLSNGFLMVLATALLVGTLLAPAAQAAMLIDFIDNSDLTASYAFLSDTNVWFGSWSQTVASSNTTISGIVAYNDGRFGHAWLLDQVGPGTTAANVLAETDFLAPVIADYFDLTSAPYTTFFTGLNLAPGTYYLVLQGPSGLYLNNYDWLGDFLNVGETLAPGFSVGLYASTSSPAAFVPASDFKIYIGDLWFYRVESVVVPLPGTLLLLSPALVGILAWRRLT